VPSRAGSILLARITAGCVAASVCMHEGRGKSPLTMKAHELSRTARKRAPDATKMEPIGPPQRAQILGENASAELHQLHRITIGAQVLYQPFDLLGIAGLAFDIGDQALGWQRGEDALVINLDDIDVVIVE
jgi:hypothetical protein